MYDVGDNPGHLPPMRAQGSVIYLVEFGLCHGRRKAHFIPPTIAVDDRNFLIDQRWLQIRMLGINCRQQFRMQCVKNASEQVSKSYSIFLGKAGDNPACAVESAIRISEGLLKLDCLLSFHCPNRGITTTYLL